MKWPLIKDLIEEFEEHAYSLFETAEVPIDLPKPSNPFETTLEEG